MKDLKDAIRSIPDFPKKGILFRDITTLLQDKECFKRAIDQLGERYINKEIDVKSDYWNEWIEARLATFARKYKIDIN